MKIRDLKANTVSQFNDLRKHPYRLQSVFVHRGYHNSGHYWIYIFDFLNNVWRKYNDGYVTEVIDRSEIFLQEPGDRPATPYFLVYVKDEAKVELVDSVCRAPMELPAPESQDTVMEDYGQPLELPATEADSYGPVNTSQQYGVTETYDVASINGNSNSWDNRTSELSTITW